MKHPAASIIALNLLLVLVAAAFAYYGSTQPADAAMGLFLLLVPLWLLNGVALFVSMFQLPRSRPYFQALLLSSILLLVIGLGVCGFSLSHLNIH